MPKIPNVRKQAQALAAVAEGQSVSGVARKFGINRSTLQSWQSKQDVRPDFAKLLATYLQKNLETLTKQLDTFKDENWLQTQSAADLAILHGVVADKGVRLLEAAERAHQRVLERERQQENNN